MQKYQDVVQRTSGQAVAGASVTVQSYPAGVDAVIYSDNSGTVATNPLTTDSLGNFSFYADDGRYQLVIMGTGITTRTVTDVVLDSTADTTPEGFGAVGDGTTDDSQAFIDAVAANRNVLGSSGKTYQAGGIDLSNSQTLDYGFALAKSPAASSYIAKLSDYASAVTRAYVSDATASTVAFKFGPSHFARLTDSWILNAATVIDFNAAASSISRPILSNLLVSTFTTNGVNVGTSTSEINAVNVYIDSGIDTVNNYPKRGTVGWRQNTPVGAYAVGGHLLSNVTTIDSETGFYFTDAQLTKLSNCIADTTAGYGIKLDGACSYMDFDGAFVGTTMGVYVGGTSSSITFNNLRTILTGTIPPWSVNPNFFLSAAPYYDVTVANTASVKISGDTWSGGHAVSVAAGATLTITGGERMNFSTSATVAAATTIFLGINGQNATENLTQWRMPYSGYIIGFDVYVGSAPGAAKSFTYTVRAAGADTAITAAITGAASFSAGVQSGAVFAAKGTAITLKLVTDAAAAVTTHSGNIHVVAA